VIVFSVVSSGLSRKRGSCKVDRRWSPASRGLAPRVDTLNPRNVLDSAGIPSRAFPVLPAAQQFAEKHHAYAFRRPDRPNSRVRDLVDMLLLRWGDMRPEHVLGARFRRHSLVAAATPSRVRCRIRRISGPRRSASARFLQETRPGEARSCASSQPRGSSSSPPPCTPAVRASAPTRRHRLMRPATATAPAPAARSSGARPSGPLRRRARPARRRRCAPTHPNRSGRS
jgi:hypothetical protein